MGPEHVCQPRLRVPASQLRTTAQFILSGDDNTFLMLRSWQQSSFQLMESGVTEKYIEREKIEERQLLLFLFLLLLSLS